MPKNYSGELLTTHSCKMKVLKHISVSHGSTDKSELQCTVYFYAEVIHNEIIHNVVLVCGLDHKYSAINLRMKSIMKECNLSCFLYTLYLI